MRRLIVNADDFGRSPGVNAGILQAHRRGIVTSATLMVNEPAAAAAACLARSVPQLGLGLHVALTGGPPTLPADRIPSLLGPQGRLPAAPDGLASAAGPELVMEVEAQVERFRGLTGRLPTHLDTHHHAHRLPSVLEALVRVAAAARLPVRAASAEVRERLQREGVPTTDRFVESFFGPSATLRELLTILRDLPEGTTELMCHPAVVDDDLRRISSYAEPRARELEVLTLKDASEECARLSVRLMHFGDL